MMTTLVGCIHFVERRNVIRGRKVFELPLTFWSYQKGGILTTKINRKDER